MAATAGQIAEAGRVPNERIATTVRTSSVGSITTTETEVDSVTAALVDGRTYRIRWAGPVQSTAGGDNIRLFIRQTNTSGAQLQLDNHQNQASSIKYGFIMEVEFTATSTADHEFIASLIRLSGTGTISSVASATQPAYLYVDYISG